MPKQKRLKTKYPGVYYIKVTSSASKKEERIYYIVYRRDGKKYEERAGRQFQDNMTPARASFLRTEKIEGKKLPNVEQRERKKRSGKWTLNRLFDEYLEVRGPDLKRQRDQINLFNRHIRDRFGNKEPHEIHLREIDKLKVQLSGTYSPQTIKHILSQISRIVNFGISHQLCQPLPFKIEMPSFDNRKTEDLTTEQMERLLNAIEEEQKNDIKDIMLLALYTGMRKSEMLGLLWKDIDFERGFIFIREPKSGVNQKIPINIYTEIILIKRKGEQAIGYVFPGRNGKKRDQFAFSKGLSQVRDRAGLPKDFRPLHGLRHVYASMLASSGEVDMYTLQKLLTHKSPQMTQRYAHLRDETLKKASNLAGEIIRKISKESK